MRIILLVLLTSLTLLAQTPYESGKSLYKMKGCYSCHGHKAEGMHMYPRLANRSKGFLSYKLKYFRDKKSDNQQQEMMIDFAVNLSDKDIDDLTTYLYEYIDESLDEKYDDSYQTWGDGGS